MQERVTRAAAPRALLATAVLALLAGCGGNDDADDAPLAYQAEIRRTAMGVPHIKASN